MFIVNLSRFFRRRPVSLCAIHFLRFDYISTMPAKRLSWPIWLTRIMFKEDKMQVTTESGYIVLMY